MTQEKVSPLRERMMEDMRIRGMQEASQKAHIRALKDFTTFLGRSPDTAEPDDLRAYQLHMADTNVNRPPDCDMSAVATCSSAILPLCVEIRFWRNPITLSYFGIILFRDYRS
jgi:hypothetical protein